MGEWEILKVSLHSWQRDVNPVILWRTPPPSSLYCLPPFFKIWSPPPPLSCHLQLPLLLLLSYFFGWMAHLIWCATLLNDNMDLYMSSLSTLVPEGPWYVFYTTRHQVCWGLTHNMVFYWYSNLISYTHTSTKTAHSGASGFTHTYSYIFAPVVMCSQQLPLLH